MTNTQATMTILKTLCNQNRFAIVSLLVLRSKTGKRNYCVGEIANEVGISQSLASHQLSYLEARGILTRSRMGKSMCYTLSSSPMTKKTLDLVKLLK